MKKLWAVVAIILLFSSGCTAESTVELVTAPAFGETVSTEPVSTEPVSTEPVSTEPVSTEPATEPTTEPATEVAETVYNVDSTFNLAALGPYIFVYKFSDMEEVVYQFDGFHFLLAEDLTTNTSYEYQREIFFDNDGYGAIFLAISEDYWLFEVDSGRKVAVAIDFKKTVELGEYVYQLLGWDQLTAEERSSFDFISSTELMENPAWPN